MYIHKLYLCANGNAAWIPIPFVIRCFSWDTRVSYNVHPFRAIINHSYNTEFRNRITHVRLRIDGV